MNRAINLPAILVATSILLFGCSKSDDSSSSSSEVSAASGSSAISLSSKVSVVEAKTTDSTARTANIETSGFATTADYNVDETSIFVFEQSADVLYTVNEILCMIGQSRPDLMLNAGNYNAQID